MFTPAFQEEFERINADLGVLEHEGGRAYREELFCDLIAYTEAYRTIICYRELGIYDANGIDNFREEIENLLKEQDGEFRTDNIRALVSILDETDLSLRESSRIDSAKPEPSGAEAGNTLAPAWDHRSYFYPSGKRTGLL
jgi:hypothetical protein